MVKDQKPVMTFTIEFDGHLCGVIGLKLKKTFIENQQRSVIGSVSRIGTKE
jgi:hypothetical protein